MVTQHEHWISLEEYHEIEQNSEEKYEYADGRIYQVSGKTCAHCRIAINMVCLLDAHLQDKACRVVSSDMKVLPLGGENPSYFPDASVTCSSDDYQDDSEAIRSPHLIIEVLSPSTFARKRGEKFKAYQACPTVEEYVMVSLHHREVEVYRREGTNMWTFARYMAEDNVQLASVGLTITMAEIYAQTNIQLLELPAAVFYAY